MSIFRNPLFTMKFRASMIPMRNPLATMAGMIGTKMSPSVLMACLYHGCFAVAAAFASSVLAPVRPEMLKNSSYTLLTTPVPRMI